MQIKVMHREQCFAAAGGYGQEYNTESITIPTMIISISCLDKAIPNRLEKYRRENKNIINVAYVQFDDIDSSEAVNGETPMSESDAKTIVDAFMKYKDRVEQIIVHCDAGYSRSPAVAAALAKALGMSDEVYFSSGQYYVLVKKGDDTYKVPYPFDCDRTVEALNRKNSEEEALTAAQRLFFWTEYKKTIKLD